VNKTYDPKTLRHEEARHALARLVHQMGFVWNDHHIEMGIDALIEITDPSTGRGLGAYVGVQVKTALRYQAESDTEFSFSVDPNDLTYWLGAKLPVLLIVGRPAEDEYFAVHVQAYFKGPEAAGSKTVRFHKQRDRFSVNQDWQRRLHGVGQTFTRGLSWPPVQRPEILKTNLLEAQCPESVYSGPTGFTDRRDLIAKLKTTPAAEVHEVIIKEGKVWSPMNLADPLLGEGIVDRDKVEVAPFRDLAFHADPAKRRYAVELLQLCLNTRLRREGVHWIKDAEMYCFVPNRVPTSRISRSVVSDSGTSKQGVLFPTFRDSKLIRCRHAAMTAEFFVLGKSYYLEINPTCFFSSDGRQKHRRHEELLQRLKILQKQRDYYRGLFCGGRSSPEPRTFFRRNIDT